CDRISPLRCSATQTASLPRPVASCDSTIDPPRWKWSPCGWGRFETRTCPGSSAGAACPSSRASSCSKVRVLSCSGFRFSGFFFGGIGALVSFFRSGRAEHSRSKAACPAPRAAASVAEVHILKRLLDLHVLDAGDGGLEVVPLLAADTQFVALNRGLHLDLAVLDLLDDALGEGRIDPLLHDH